MDKANKFSLKSDEKTNQLSGQDDKPVEKLDPAVLNRILKHRTKARPETLLAISRVVNERADASIDDLWAKVNADDIPGQDESGLLLASSFAIWAAQLLAAMGIVGEDGRSKVPPGIKFAFSARNEQPHWIENLTSINTLRESISDVNNVYVAEDLEQLVKEGKIDGFFMLRDTFESIFRNMPEEEKPIRVCRISDGYGTYCYLIGKKEEFEKFEPLKEPSGRNRPYYPDAYYSVAQLDYLNDQFTKNHPHIYHFNNTTVNKHLEEYLTYPNVRDSLQLGYTTKSFSLKKAEKSEKADHIVSLDSMNALLNSMMETINKPKTIIALVGFEPILNSIYHKFLVSLPKDIREQVRHEYLNLSRLINKKSTYNLYCTSKALNDPYKLAKLNDFVSLIKKQQSFHSLINSTITELLYPRNDAIRRPEEDELNHNRILRNDADLSLRNSALDFIDLASRLLVDAL
ncbi:hypothetical protein [Spirosoma sp.]|uniref:hypothetical protein n=1 Tax=Spirosoma sp. TaxID=1899569 RepID=UPI00263833A7|nr:hypothetical protein [Spirosoma sp.]MCX6212825.1 hypothetical protein [Spirosoma sp.]